MNCLHCVMHHTHTIAAYQEGYFSHQLWLHARDGTLCCVNILLG
jgi:hypothetical protein